MINRNRKLIENAIKQNANDMIFATAVVRQLNKRELCILFDLLENQSQKVIAKSFDISAARVHQIIWAIYRKINNILKSLGTSIDTLEGAS